MKKLFILILILLLSIPCFATNEWRAATGASTIPGTTLINNIDTVSFQNIVDPLDRLLANYREGAKIIYSSAAALTINAGEVVCSNSDASIRKFRKNDSSTTLTVATGIDTGAEAKSTTYYIYAICDADAFTVVYSLSATLPAAGSYTYYKRLGSFYNNSSSNVDASLISNDDNTLSPETQNSTIYLKNNINMSTKTISNGYLGKTTTGTTLFNNGTDVTCPTGCYITGGIKQSDSNFTYFNYACP